MKLTYKKGKQDKIHISVDGEYSFTVDEAYFVSMGIYNGMEIDEDRLEEISDAVSERRAYNYAVSLLSRRDYSEKELLDKLRVKGCSDDASERAVNRLKIGEYVDDERFAVMYVKELMRLKSYGKRRIEQELYRKGIDREIIAETLKNTEFDSEKLQSLILRKYKRYLSDTKGINKTVNALLRLGYSYGEIRDALREINENYDLSEEEIYD